MPKPDVDQHYLRAMIIAVYADLKTLRSRLPDLYFVKSLLHHLSAFYPENKYFLLQPNAGDITGSELDSFFLINLKTKPGLFYSYRLNRKVAQALKKIKADVIFSIDAVLSTNIPQAAVLFRIDKRRKLATEKLKAIFVLSEKTKNVLEAQYNVGKQKILVLHGGASKLFEPVDDEIKSLIKDKYTDGKEFFIYRGRVKEENNIIPLLKAFSLFKKRQKSSMKLVLMGKVFWENNDFAKLINTYKYRDDVVLISDELPAEEANIVAAAYALVQPYPGNNLFLFDAIQCGVPVLTVNSSTLREISPDGAVFFEVSNDADMADKMMLLYKDEALRSRIIEKANALISNYTWKKTTALVAKTFAN